MRRPPIVHTHARALALAFALAHATLWTEIARAAERLTYIDLAHRLTDLKRLARLPEPGEQCAQWSSYDRTSRYDAASNTYVGWNANRDGNGFIRQEGDRFVLAEMDGPGCIWRMWSAAPKEGHVRIFLDGSEEPAVDLTFAGFFDGQNKPFSLPALVHQTASGWNNYVPIPYQKSCKIVAEAGWGRFYHFVYGTFVPGTQVPTFKRDLSTEDMAALEAADSVLSASGDTQPSYPQQEREFKTLQLAPKAVTAVSQIQGARAVTTLRVKPELPPAPKDREVLRELALRIRWDGETNASVWAPLGDFFGTAPGRNCYRSFPLGVRTNGWWYCHWYMPFAESAQLEVVNDGAHPVKAHFEVFHAPLTDEPSRLGRFHAKWHRDAFLAVEPERQIDWTILKTEGTGRFLGVMLHVWNPRGGWWGEGDEKFFVDGEKSPSTFGTGSEDYFGYAWCNPALFENCYHNQTISMTNKGHVSVNRWQISDNVPFQKSFEGALEKYFPNTRPTQYASTAYWYLAADGKDAYAPVPLADRLGYWTNQTALARVAGAIEVEEMKVAAKTAGNTQEQVMDEYDGSLWSNAAQLRWTGAKPGDTLDLVFNVKKSRTYALAAQLTKAKNNGTVQLHLDGQKVGEPVDLYSPSVVPTGALSLGSHKLKSGEHRLRIEITGAHPDAGKSYAVGIDYLQLQPGK